MESAHSTVPSQASYVMNAGQVTPKVHEVMDIGEATDLQESSEVRKTSVNLSESETSVQGIMHDMAMPFRQVVGNNTKRKFMFKKKRSAILDVFSKQATKTRLVTKSGALNTVSANVYKKDKLVKDFFISAIRLNWSWIFLLFASSFFISWLIFAVLWYIIFTVHGDFDEANLANETFVPCASAIVDFTSCFLFSLETQHTIGYGGR